MARSSSSPLSSPRMFVIYPLGTACGILIEYSWLDGRHVVFGEVLEGYDIVDKIQNVPKLPGDKPAKAVKIVKSGELEISDADSENQGSRDEL